MEIIVIISYSIAAFTGLAFLVFTIYKIVELIYFIIDKIQGYGE